MDTEQIYDELAHAAPVAAHTANPRRVPREWEWRDQDGVLRAIIIGGA